MKNIVTLSLIVICSISCTAQWGNRVKGNGENTTIKRSVGDYDRIGVSGFFDVDLVSGKEGDITLEGESNILEHIVTEVKNGQLNIKVEKGYNLNPSSWKNGIHITVPIEEIDAVALSGSGDIVGKTRIKTHNFKTSMSGSGDITLEIETESISSAMSGSGDINLSGRATNFDATISGSGDIAAYNLEAENVEATVSGSANIEVTAHKMLKARVSGSGDINYKGNPSKVEAKTSGSGNITKH